MMIGVKRVLVVLLFLLAAVLLVPAVIMAGEAPAVTRKIDTGDTAWILVSTALVMLMTPGKMLYSVPR